jgi:hypothetical protein
VVNGSLRGAKEQRSFKPQAAGSIPAGRTPDKHLPIGRSVFSNRTISDKNPKTRYLRERDARDDRGCVSST